ncbi:MAG: anaerobic ribonucleoside-triphosphate reductase activating protein [Bacilli bacterium]
MDFAGFQKISLVDYDRKISCTLFTAGCNFRCPFCHNSDLVIYAKNAEYIPFSEILDYLTKRKGMLDAVVITGGEPTLMPDLIEKMIAIKNLGYKIKLDTNGTHPDILKNLVESHLVDYVAMDIKNSYDGYPKTTGVKDINMKPIIESINYLLSGVVDYEFRTTLVREFHNDDEIRMLGKLIQGARRYFLQHFINNENCIEHDLHDVPLHDALRFQSILLPYINEVKLRGYDIEDPDKK